MLRGGNQPDLHRLLERCRRGDQLAWKQLVDNFSALVYSVARRYSLGEEDCADVFQATFQALYSNLDKIESANAIPKWISVTAANSSLRILRSSKKHVPLMTDDDDLTEVLASDDASAEAEAVIAASAHSLRQAVAAMGGRCAPLLQALYLDEEASYEHACQKLGLPMGSLGPTRARCLAKLRKILEEDGFFV
ncbi:MAG TPA: sigma-70 family RNA polymerase sigma factor [Fimbriimonas sp.]|nr:sigma-70 family RNA polymerase sigma factor [Fimbriimonas sp.]